MKVYDAQSIRNVALVGHSGSGKTQLVSTLLFDAGAVNRLGRVDEGTTVTDYDEEEIARKHTLSAALAYAEWNKHKINFIDTPGMANFLSDARAALRVADAALVVVDAVAGVEVSTEKIWEVATELGVPRLVALNRLDRFHHCVRAEDGIQHLRLEFFDPREELRGKHASIRKLVAEDDRLQRTQESTGTARLRACSRHRAAGGRGNAFEKAPAPDFRRAEPVVALAGFACRRNRVVVRSGEPLLRPAGEQVAERDAAAGRAVECRRRDEKDARKIAQRRSSR